jgi:hypothetical protein
MDETLEDKISRDIREMYVRKAKELKGSIPLIVKPFKPAF